MDRESGLSAKEYAEVVGRAERLLAVPFGPDTRWESEAREVLDALLHAHNARSAEASLREAIETMDTEGAFQVLANGDIYREMLVEALEGRSPQRSLTDGGEARAMLCPDCGQHPATMQLVMEDLRERAEERDEWKTKYEQLKATQEHALETQRSMRRKDD